MFVVVELAEVSANFAKNSGFLSEVFNADVIFAKSASR